jgi:catechol 2,3-dioxygenase-like lactoylglutathione lyase family enzyme
VTDWQERSEDSGDRHRRHLRAEPGSVELYEKLGFEVVGQNDRGTTLAYGDTKLFLFEARMREDVQQRELGLLSNPPGLDHISFLGDDVDALYRRLVAEGTKTGGAPSDQDWGARLRLRDLDGKNLYFLRGL